MNSTIIQVASSRVLPMLGAFMILLRPAAGQPATLTTLYSFGQADAYGIAIGPGGVIYGSQAVDGLVYSLTPPSSVNGLWTANTVFSSISNPDGLAVGADGAGDA